MMMMPNGILISRRTHIARELGEPDKTFGQLGVQTHFRVEHIPMNNFEQFQGSNIARQMLKKFCKIPTEHTQLRENDGEPG